MLHASPRELWTGRLCPVERVNYENKNNSPARSDFGAGLFVDQILAAANYLPASGSFFSVMTGQGGWFSGLVISLLSVM